MKKMPVKQKNQIKKMDNFAISNFQIRLQVECGMTEQEASAYINQAFDEKT